MKNIYKPQIICINSDENYQVKLYNTNTTEYIPEESNGKLHYILICDTYRIDYYAAAPWQAINYAKRRIEVKGRGTAKGRITIKLKDIKTNKEFLGATVEKIISRRYIPYNSPRKRKKI